MLKMCVLGAALSGKSTICTKLAAKYDIPVISTGALLREAAYDNPTELGLKAKQYLVALGHAEATFAKPGGITCISHVMTVS